MKKLIVFLKKHKAYRKFKKNFKNSHNVNEDLEDFCIRRVPEDYFDAAFIWGPTKEGHRFWDVLSDKWQESLKKDEC